MLVRIHKVTLPRKREFSSFLLNTPHQEIPAWLQKHPPSSLTFSPTQDTSSNAVLRGQAAWNALQQPQDGEGERTLDLANSLYPLMVQPAMFSTFFKDRVTMLTQLDKSSINKETTYFISLWLPFS